MNEREIKQLSLQLMKVADVAYLTTIDHDGFPQTRALFNLRNQQQFPVLADFFSKQQDDLLIYFTTNTASAKLAQLRDNPKVSVYYCQPNNFHGLMLSGVMEIVTTPAVKAALWQPGWELYYPGGVQDPDYTVLKLRPLQAKHYRQLSSACLNLKGGFAVNHET